MWILNRAKFPAVVSIKKAEEIVNFKMGVFKVFFSSHSVEIMQWRPTRNNLAILNNLLGGCLYGQGLFSFVHLWPTSFFYYGATSSWNKRKHFLLKSKLRNLEIVLSFIALNRFGFMAVRFVRKEKLVAF